LERLNCYKLRLSGDEVAPNLIVGKARRRIPNHQKGRIFRQLLEPEELSKEFAEYAPSPAHIYDVDRQEVENA
jgi:hypothetical protein